MTKAHNYKEALGKLPESVRPQRDTPTVKIFTPDGPATWYLYEYNKTEETAFGLCDLGFRMPELGYVYIPELAAVRSKTLHLPPEVDLHWDGTLEDAYKALDRCAPNWLPRAEGEDQQ